MRIRQNPTFPSSIPELVRELSVLWRELATAFNSTLATTVSTSGQNRNGRGTDTDDYLITTAGLVLQSPDGDYWLVEIDNTGALVTTNLGTTKP